MKEHFCKLLLTVLCVFLFVHCEESIDPADRTGVFDEVYREMQKNYAYFELYPFSADSQFEAFRKQIGPATDDEQLFGIIAGFLRTFEDGHLNIYTPYGTSTFQFWPGNYVSTHLHELYLDGLIFASPSVQYGYISNSSLGFIKIPDFTQGAPAYEAIRPVMAEFRRREITGLIIDIRDNIGGNSAHAEIIAREFIPGDKPTFRTRYRNSSERSSFTDWVDHEITGIESPFSSPVVILTNRLTYSAAETFLLMVRNQDHVKVIGDVTGGGAGNTISRYLSNGWVLRMSNSQKRMLEEDLDFQKIGITPDIRIQATREKAGMNVDEILECAIMELKGN